MKNVLRIVLGTLCIFVPMILMMCCIDLIQNNKIQFDFLVLIVNIAAIIVAMYGAYLIRVTLTSLYNDIK